MEQKKEHRHNILLIDQFFYPDESAIAQLLTDLAIGLAKKNFRISVLTGSDVYAGDNSGSHEVDSEIEELEINISRIPRTFGKDLRKWKTIKQFWFYLAAALYLFRNGKFDLYVTQTTPPLIPWFAYVLSKWNRRPYAIIAQDIWPEALRAHKIVSDSSLLYRVLRALMNRAYKNARVVIVLGDYMKQIVIAKGVLTSRIKVIPNWALPEVEKANPDEIRRENESLSSPLDKKTLAFLKENRFRLLYSGNMGLAHEFATLLDSMNLLKREKIKPLLFFAGSGARKAEISGRVKTLELEEVVKFLPHQPRRLVANQLALASMNVITMAPGWEGIIVPSKLYGIMAAGNAILYIGPGSEISDIINKYNCGLHVMNGDIESLSTKLREFILDPGEILQMGKRARDAYLQYGGMERSITQYCQVFADTLKM